MGPVGPGDPRTDVSHAEPRARTSTCSGPRTYGELPDVLRAADAGLIPYARNELTESIFPMKVYEYLAAGLPVVATPLPALAGLDGGRARRPTQRGSPTLLDEALAGGQPAIGAPSARRGAASHSWERRLDEIAAAIARAVKDLLVTTHTPVLRSGQAVRTYGVARALAAHGGLDAALRALRSATSPTRAFRAIPGIELREVVPSRGSAAPARLRRGAAARRSPPASRAASRPSWRPRPPGSRPSPAAGA